MRGEEKKTRSASNSYFLFGKKKKKRLYIVKVKELAQLSYSVNEKISYFAQVSVFISEPFRVLLKLEDRIRIIINNYRKEVL